MNFEKEDNANFDILLEQQGYSKRASGEIFKWYSSSSRLLKKKTSSE
ncbi:MAG: hypothetical protein ABSD92_05875 [Candidatus Bathyarchaeia archaeon]|jgi:hypothetical protein